VHYIGADGGFQSEGCGIFERVRSLPLRQAKMAAFGMTLKKFGPEEDDNIKALYSAGTR
jgi:hypothetical protein